MKVLVLHGANLNLFGRREPHIYGTMTLAEIDQRLRALAGELGVELEVFQSNHEGALHDAIRTMPFPVIEVHLSNTAAREPWRAHSIISPAVKGTVQGLGWRSYATALRGLVELVRDTAKA
jgi:3-dehydroquinate dehydratase-2